ncbi:MAG: hypothetical protein OEZ34_01100 [Spirochaetia bacterium]|nr:hypothetical protein [Spirochaetia bacterium]
MKKIFISIFYLSFLKISAIVLTLFLMNCSAFFHKEEDDLTAFLLRLFLIDQNSPSTVVAGGSNTCVILDDRNPATATHKIKCWGLNDAGQLGLGDTLPRGDNAGEMGNALPYIDLGTGRTIKKLSVGRGHICAILDNHSVKCWGGNNNGELGRGDTASIGDNPGEMGDSITLIDPGTGRSIVDILTSAYPPIAVPNRSSYAILDNGSLISWGGNESGKLGQNISTVENIGDVGGEMGVSLSPVSVPGTFMSKKLAKSAHGNFVCSIWSDSSGLINQVFCWGDNFFGQLGLESSTSTFGDSTSTLSDPAYNYTNLGTVGYPVEIAAGAGHACSLLNNGYVKCWGNNDNGQLGLELPASVPTLRIGDGINEMGNNLPYVNLGIGRTVKSIHTGYNHTCAILDNNRIKCWGANNFGQLGLGHNTALGNNTAEMGDYLPYVDLGYGRTVISMTSGWNHNCAVLDNMQIKCWGVNSGQLGLGHTNNIGDNPGEMGDNLPPVKLLLDP